MIKQNGRIRVARAVENIYTLLTNVKQPMQMQINVEISVGFFLHYFVGKEASAVVDPGEEYNCEKASILALWLSA